MISDVGDVVLAAFPFVEVPRLKRRPAVVLSDASRNADRGETILAMVTTAGAVQWPDDVELGDLEAAGLMVRCVVRPRIASLQNDLLVRRFGALSEADRQACSSAIRAALAI